MRTLRKVEIAAAFLIWSQPGMGSKSAAIERSSNRSQEKTKRQHRLLGLLLEE
jgi:hypothetical protein